MLGLMVLTNCYCASLDVIEEIISEEIVDETDRYEDNQSKKRAKRITTAAIMRGSVALCCTARLQSRLCF
jgi:hypothetical protein